MTTETINFNKIDQNIFVYKNPFKDLSGIMDSLNSITWEKWYNFGDIYKILNKNFYRSKSFPSEQDWSLYLESSLVSDQYKDILNVFYKTTKHYVDTVSLSLENLVFLKADICKYYNSKDASKSESNSPHLENNSRYSMSFHTDYPQEDAEGPGEKQALTCNMYLNSNYNGGEIEFKVFSNNDSFTRITYKPEEGDVIIFPSKPPYWHGVRETTDGEKYFVRSFWYVDEQPSDAWVENQKKYGADTWIQMEKDRMNSERHSGVYIKNDYN